MTPVQPSINSDQSDSTDQDVRYAIGIDLGTTNSALAYVALYESEVAAKRTIRLFPILQLVAPGELLSRSVLPSSLYLPGEHDLPPGSTALPWDPAPAYVVGELAREQGAHRPGRLVTSAKSWLSHSGVDRTAPILPWGGEDGVAGVSPVEASARYLRHIREAWDAQMAAEAPENRFEEQLIILTVPASFDEVARELTVAAAQAAGYPRTILLEEPLSAFYAWLATHETEWQRRMIPGQLILVCDVGGGTTDFSILGIDEGTAGLRFNRLAVGEHLMLGGDNMDMALGRLLEGRLLGQPGKLDALRWHQLVHQCRQAKETLLGGGQEVTVSVLGRGGQLIGGTLSGKLTPDETQQVIVDGFFPQVGLEDVPERGRRSGLTELGLPYVQDPAITRHLAAFWQRFAPYLKKETGREEVFPDYILFNGGTLAAQALRDRIRDLVATWFRPVAGHSWNPIELPNPRPAAAVAMGATYYGLVRLGRGVRVGSGSPRAYYVGVEAGAHRPGTGDRVAVCLVPRGTEEGFETRLDEPAFAALANQPVTFQVFTSSTRLGDELGQVVRLPREDVSVLPPIRTVLRFGRKGEAQRLPVQIGVRLTEIGTLELWCQSQQSSHRWHLQFDVRQPDESSGSEVMVEETLDEARVDAAREVIARTFGGSGASGHPPESLRRNLEEALDLPKEAWPTPLIRSLADCLLEESQARALGAEYEAAWLNQLGFCLRPGYGDPLDDWRLKRVWRIFLQGLQHPRQVQCRTEWWILWRRIAGGLKAGQQMELYQQVRGYLQPSARRKAKAGAAMPKHVGGGEQLEVWMMTASLEWLTADIKTTLGRDLLAGLDERAPKARELWSLSRLGTREALHGPLDRLIPPAEVASWMDRLLALRLEANEGTARALIHLAAFTGDRARDLTPEQRMRVAHWLTSVPRAERFLDLLQNPDSRRSRAEQDWIFGESLPAGLVIATLDSPDDA